jgi:hypothetical protein
VPLSPRQAFEDNFRPAELMLRVYRLLETDGRDHPHALLDELKAVIGAEPEEILLLLYNDVFVGVVRERASVAPGMLRKAALANLLRQSVAAACTALDSYLPALLRANIGTVIERKGHRFLPPPSDKETNSFFKDFQFDLADIVRVIAEPDPVFFIYQKMEVKLRDKAAGNATAVHAIGSVLGVEDPWKQIGDRLSRNPSEIKTTLSQTITRRNDIIHRADRSKADLDGAIQPIEYSWTVQSVDVIKHVCLALDELVAEQMRRMRSEIAAGDAVVVPTAAGRGSGVTVTEGAPAG